MRDSLLALSPGPHWASMGMGSQRWVLMGVCREDYWCLPVIWRPPYGLLWKIRLAAICVVISVDLFLICLFYYRVNEWPSCQLASSITPPWYQGFFYYWRIRPSLWCYNKGTPVNIYISLWGVVDWRGVYPYQVVDGERYTFFFSPRRSEPMNQWTIGLESKCMRASSP